MTPFVRALMAGPVFLLLAACASPTRTTIEGGVQLAGFQTFPTPRTFDGPGSVFRITRDRIRYPVAALNVPVEKVGNENFANYSRTAVWSLEAALKYVGASQVLSDAQVSAHLGSTVEITLQIGQGDRERTYDGDVKAALKAASIEYSKDSRYYVIRETIGVSELSYRFNRKKDMSAQVNAAFKKAVEVNGGLKWTSSEQSELVQKFDKPHRVFYTVEEISPPTGLLGTAPELRRVNEPVEWVAEGR